jgi:hypothetical protein
LVLFSVLMGKGMHATYNQPDSSLDHTSSSYLNSAQKINSNSLVLLSHVHAEKDKDFVAFKVDQTLGSEKSSRGLLQPAASGPVLLLGSQSPRGARPLVSAPPSGVVLPRSGSAPARGERSTEETSWPAASSPRCDSSLERGVPSLAAATAGALSSPSRAGPTVSPPATLPLSSTWSSVEGRGDTLGAVVPGLAAASVQRLQPTVLGPAKECCGCFCCFYENSRYKCCY